MAFRRALTRRLGSVLGPIMFSVAGGHLRSAIVQRPVDAAGHPLPWYTYPAVDFLSELDFRGKAVAEVGGGYSTLWWAGRAQRVLTLEPDGSWYRRLRDWTAARGNVDVRHVPSPAAVAPSIPADEYDVIIVDGGGERTLHTRTALTRVKQTGVVILDNADESLGSVGREAVIRDAQEAGWLRVDFIGHTAGATRLGCTSMFFQPTVSIFAGLPHPRVQQVRRGERPRGSSGATQAEGRKRESDGAQSSTG